jgi:hypothetical protein
MTVNNGCHFGISVGSDRGAISHVLDNYLRRNRRTFDVARTCQGARSGGLIGSLPLSRKQEAERLVAAIFSYTIREYSAGEHVPRALIRLRRPTVSHEANGNSVIITDNDANTI